MGVLPIAECLYSFVRHADVVKMANFTMATSLLSNDPKKGTFKSPVFYTFKLFSNNCLGNSVDTYVACDTFSTALYKGIDVLDATTVYSKENNTVFINVVNRSSDKPITADLISSAGNFSGKAEASVINSDDLKAPFAFDKQSQYVPVTKDVKLNGNKLSFTFPPHSFTQIKVSINKK
jgi:alpha-N-arabinofuranosidase